MNRLSLSLWLRKHLNRRVRLTAAILLSFLIIGALLFFLPAVAPRYLFTLEDKFTVLTPPGFELGELYNFENVYQDEAANTKTSGNMELVLPRPDNRMIIFKYPEVVTLGRPTYLGNEITQSVDFTVKSPPANGLIQIWELNSSLDEFLENSKNYTSIEFTSFNSSKGKNGLLNYTIWDYSYNKNGKAIRALEAFFDDKPYMYRVSLFFLDEDYGKDIQKIFDDMVKSVRVK